MAQIYSPWSNPEEDSGILLASKEFEAPMPDSGTADEDAEGAEAPESEDSAEPNMMAEAMSIINEQAQLIKSLTAQLTGAGTGDRGE